MSASKAKELREKRVALHAEATKLLDKPELTKEDREKYDRMILDIDQMKGDVDRIERAEALELELRATQKPPEAKIGGAGEGAPEAKTAAVGEFRTALRKHGVAAVDKLRPESRTIVEGLNSRYFSALRNYLAQKQEEVSLEDRAILMGKDAEYRDMGVGSGGAGGYFVPQGFVYEVESAMKYFGPMLEVASIMDTATGQALPWPTDNDTTNTGEQVDENAQVSQQDIALGQITFNAYKYSTKLIKVSIELLQDSAFDLEGYIRSKFAERLGRIINTKMTTGAGTTEPKGIIVAATAGPTAVGASANTGGSESATNTVGSTDYVELEHSVDRVYRRGAMYMMNDSTLKYTKQILDKYGRPLWKPGFNAGDPDTINGYPYAVNNDMAVLAASAKTIAFGQLKKYMVRRVKELSVLKLSERFADYGQVAFVGFARYDGNLLDAGTHPVKFLVQHA